MESSIINLFDSLIKTSSNTTSLPGPWTGRIFWCPFWFHLCIHLTPQIGPVIFSPISVVPLGCSKQLLGCFGEILKGRLRRPWLSHPFAKYARQIGSISPCLGWKLKILKNTTHLCVCAYMDIIYIYIYKWVCMYLCVCVSTQRAQPRMLSSGVCFGGSVSLFKVGQAQKKYTYIIYHHIRLYYMILDYIYITLCITSYII